MKTRPRSKARLVILLMAILALVAGACGDDEGGGGDLETTEIALGLGFDPGLAPHIIALEKGWFEEAGFTSVETSTFTAGALAGEALAAGEIDLWSPANMPPVNMRHNGLPIVLVGTPTDFPEKVVVRADANLETPEDLLRIKIGLLVGASSSSLIAKIAEHYGVDANELQLVNLPPPEQLTAFAQNEIQAFVTWNPWAWRAQQDPDTEAIVMYDGGTSFFPWDEGSQIPTEFSRMVYVMREDFIRENPNTADAMMEVLFKSQEWLRDPDNDEEAIRIFSEFTESPVEQNAAIWDDYDFDPTFDQTFVTDMSGYTEFLFETGRIPSKEEVLNWTYSDFLANWDPDIVKVEGNWQP